MRVCASAHTRARVNIVFGKKDRIVGCLRKPGGLGVLGPAGGAVSSHAVSGRELYGSRPRPFIHSRREGSR